VEDRKSIEICVIIYNVLNVMLFWASIGIIGYMKTRTSPDWRPPPTSIVELDGDNFTSYMEKTPLALVLFYAEYCKHCQQVGIIK